MTEAYREMSEMKDYVRDQALRQELLENIRSQVWTMSTEELKKLEFIIMNRHTIFDLAFLLKGLMK